MSRLAAVVATVAALVAATTGAVPAAVAQVAGRADPVSRGFQPAAVTFNPVTGSAGFTVFVRGNAALGATSSAGPVAMGGNLTVGSNFTVASQTAGTFKASGDSTAAGLLIGGSINWAGSNSNGAVNVGSSAYVKVGNMTGSTIPSNGPAPTHIVATGGIYGSKPQVALAVNQPPSSVNQSGLIDFSGAFSTFLGQSADMASCANTLVLTDANGTALRFPLSGGTTAYATLTPGTQNVLDISAVNLANISTLTFRNSPTASMPLIINVDTSGVGNNFSWTPGNINGIQNTGAPYMLWNFATATQVTIGGSSTIPGTIYAPGATVNDNDANGLNGGVIAAAYAQGGLSGSPNGGQVLAAPFAGTIGSCATPQLTIALSATPSTAVPGGTVHYTVAVTNSGSAAYTGATFADSLSGVLDDASYNSDASATGGSVSFASPNLTWTGNLAVGATATITFSVTVSNPDTGNKTLTSTITSTTAGSNCASGSTDSRCSSTILVAALALAVTASTPTTTPGATVSYTITATNSGAGAVTGAAFTDSLSGVLDDASYNNDATATTGSVTFSSPNLSWTGNLAAGAAATITFSVTVNSPDTGNKSLASTITSGTAGSNCASGSTDPKCTSTVTVLVPGLTIALTANTSSTTPGATVGYTVTVTNSGQTAYTGATFTDSLAGVLTDAHYNSDAAATAGSVAFASPSLTWTGNLAVGASATVTYSLTVNNPDTGDKLLTSTVTSATAGSNCPAGGSDTRCTSSIPVLVPGLTIAASAGSSTTTPGAVVHYTVTVTNSGQTAYTGAAFTDPLGGVLDDAAYNSDAAATAGTVSFASPSLTWTGNLAVGATATITFSVTVSNPDTGNNVLASTITSATPGSNCAAGSGAAACTATVSVAVLTIVNTSGVSTTTPGSVVRFTATFTNSGQVPYTGITIASNITNVVDDATPNGDQTATSGTLSLTATGISWTGSIPVGGTVTVTGTVTVNNPDTGNNVLASTLTTAAPGSNCPAGGTDPRCSVSVTVLTPALTIVKTANASAAVPGQAIGYTVTVTNTGQTPYAGATVTDSFAQMANDAVYNGDATTTAGSLSFAGSSLTWTGALAPGAAAVITYTVTVDSPDTGDKLVINSVSSADAGSTCPPGAATTACRVTVPVLTPALTIVKTASTPAATPGATVTYTVTVTNSGQVPYTGAAFTDPLGGVLDDAAYNGDAAATAGSVSFASPVLSWSGNLSPGAAATVTYSVTVHNPDTGDHVLANTVTSATTGSNCAAGSTDPRCSARVTVSELTITFTASTATTTPGGVVGYTATLANTGQTPYTGISVATDATGIADDATGNGDQAASSGTLSIGATGAVWTGDIPVGGTVTITSTVTVNNPDTGNHVLTATAVSSAPGSNCPAGGTDPRCTAVTDVLTPALAIVKTANASFAVPGQVIGYTVTVTNTGQTSYAGATVTDSFALMADDAVYDGDAAATSGSIAFASPSLTWTGSLAPGAAAVITYTVTVDSPDTGDKLVINSVSSADPGSACPPGATSAACRVTIAVLTPALTIVKTAATTSGSSAVATPGTVVTYTVTVTNSGQVPYAGAAFTDSLSGVLDDAAYNGDAAAAGGTVSFASPVLSWSGSLNPGAAATITYSVTVSNPDTGNQSLTNTVTSATPGSNCATGSGDSRCTATVTVVGASTLTFTQTAAAASAVAGGTVSYTITIANSGASQYTGAAFTDPLGGVLDDAAYNNDAAASSGTVSFASPDLAWAGDVPASGTVTITYTVTVHNPDTGNMILASTITSTSADSNCPASGPGPRCTATVTVSQLAITSTADVATTVPGGVVRYTGTFANTGQTPYFGISISIDGTGIADDATGNGDQAVSSGTLSIGTTGAVWTGDIPVGGTVTITSSITVNDPDTGNHLITTGISTGAPGSNCPAASPCVSSIPVLTPALTIVKTASTGFAVPGQVIGYTITVTNTGQTPYTGATVTDSLALMAGDAAYNHDAAATAGSVALTGPDLTWTGNLAPGDAAVITYTVTVDSPDTGDKLVINSVSSADAGSTCPPGSAATACRVTVPVLTPALSIAKTASTATATPGQVVTYTITVTNTGQTPYAGAAFTDPLTGVLDDAAYNHDAAATTGTVSFGSPVLSWTGNLDPGAAATITYTVTVSKPDTGNHVLANTVTSATPGSNCAAGSTDPRCTATIPVTELIISFTASTATTTPGGTVGYTATLTNTGQMPYTGISVSTDATGIADDATGNGDQAATSGILSIGATGAVWTGDIPVGGTVTITSSVTVNNPDTGDHVLTSTAVSAAPGNNCPAGSTDPQCTPVTDVLTPALTIVKAASASFAVPGQVIGYTVTITNTGQTAYAGAAVTDSFAQMAGDAGYNGNAAASAGSLSFASPVLTWTGSLAPGAAAVITYTVTVNSPDNGDKLVINSVSSAATGSTCPPGATTTACRVTVSVLTPALTITAAASPAASAPGGTVSYTITVANTGQVPYAGASFTDSLAGVLDDAAYNGDAAATAGSVSFASPVLTWTGNLNPGAAATVTFTVTVSDPDTGDHVLAATVTSATAGSNCAAGSTDPRCATSTSVAVLTIVNTAGVSTATPGTAVPYTITVTNAGQVPYTGVTVTDPLAGVLDDAGYNSDAITTAGSVTFASPALTWTGTLAPGAAATITFSVTVSSPDTGDQSLTSTVTSPAAGSNCPASGGTDPRCTAAVTVLIPALTVTKTATVATTTPGSAVGYTITVADTGPTPYTAVTVTDALDGVLPDAAYNGDATATAGSVTFDSPDLTWTGGLTPGQAATITYTVTVDNPDTGDKTLVNTATSDDPGSTCPAGTTSTACTATVTDLIPALTITKTATVSTATPGSSVGYTITVADTGQTPYTAAHVTDSLAGVLGDAAYNHDAAASTGTVSYASPVLTWTGDLDPGHTATITYTITVSNPDTGGRLLTNTAVSAAAGSTCPPGSTSPACTVTVAVIAGGLSITAPVSASLGSADPGGTISAGLGSVQVTDNRGFGADWTATVSATAFTTGGGTPAETIPLSDTFYNITALGQATGPAIFTIVPIANLASSPQAVVTATSVTGSTSATWDPLLQVNVPGSAIAGQYTATITHSVS